MSGIGIDLQPEDGPTRTPRRTGIVAATSVVLVLSVVVALVALGGNRLLDFLGPVPDYEGSGTGSVVIVVQPGDSVGEIGRKLKDADVVKSTEAWLDAANADERSRGIQPGSYELRQQMSATLALELLLDPSARVLTRVLIPEGTRLTRILELLNSEANIPLDELRALADDPDGLGLPSYANGQLEGFLFPATYEFEPGTTARAALRAMVGRFKQEAESTGLVDGASALGYTPYEVVTVASLVEKEARLAKDFGKVARVAYNRLDPSWGEPLAFDSTNCYLEEEQPCQLTASDLEVDSPYNGRTQVGLPPTPIASPGTAALEAALHPTPGDWLYFVTIDESGRNAFSTTHEQFLQDKAEAQRNGAI